MPLDRLRKRRSLAVFALSVLLLFGAACDSDGDGDADGPNLDVVEERLRDAYEEVEGMAITDIDESEGTVTIQTNWEHGPADEICDHMPEALPGVDMVVFEGSDGEELASCPA